MANFKNTLHPRYEHVKKQVDETNDKCVKILHLL
jgi:hypothetical protein